jgi:hypothetical protein
MLIEVHKNGHMEMSAVKNHIFVSLAVYSACAAQDLCTLAI